MTTPEVYSPSPDGIERDIRLDESLIDLSKISQLELSEMSLILKYPSGHDHAPKEKAPLHDIRIRTTSDQKWGLLAPLVRQAGFKPVRDRGIINEDLIHSFLRHGRPEFYINYAKDVAEFKQGFDARKTPIMTLDTVICIDGMPLEKPHDPAEAKILIAQISGKQVATETGLSLGMRTKSGDFVHLQSTIRTRYTMKPLAAEIIDEYIRKTPTVLHVPVGIDLATASARQRFIDSSAAVTIESRTNFGPKRNMELRGDDIGSPLFDSVFMGVPMHAVSGLLPWMNDIYLYAEGFFEENLPASLW